MSLSFIYILLGLLCITQIISVISMVQLWVELKAMKNSTHKIALWDPNKDIQKFEEINKETGELLSRNVFEQYQNNI